MPKQTIIPGGSGNDLFIYAHIDPSAIRDVVPKATDDFVVTELWGAGTSAYRPVLGVYGGWRKYVTDVAARCGKSKFEHTCIVGWSAGGAFALEVLEAAGENLLELPDAVVLLDAIYSSKPPGSRPGDGRVVWTAELAALERYAIAAAHEDKILVVTHSAIPTPTYASSGECVNELVRRVQLAIGKPLEADTGALQVMEHHPPVLARRAGNFRVLSFVAATAAEHIAEAHLYDEVWRAWIPWSCATCDAGAVASTRTRSLREGDRGDDVRKWQETLRALGKPIVADGIFGRRTDAATRMFQMQAALSRPGLSVDGIVGPATLAAASEELRWVKIPDPAPFPRLSDVDRDRFFGRITSRPAPNRNDPDAIQILGDWAREHIISAHVPQLAHIPGAPRSGQVLLHKDAAPQVIALFDEWQRAGLLPFILSWDGSWVPRYIRNTKVPSTHAYGIAFDINAEWNPFGRAPTRARGNVRELVTIARRHGFYWGGDFSRPDGMHFELARLA
jgi:hypothetical protein